MIRKKNLKGNGSDSKYIEKFRAVVDEHTSLSVLNTTEKSFYIIRRDLAKDYDIEVDASEAPVINKELTEPEPYEISMMDIKILQAEIVPINEAIKKVFNANEDMELECIRLAIGSNPFDYVTINEGDLKRNDIKPTLRGLMDFIADNEKGVIGFLDREYINEEGNVYYLKLSSKNLSENVFSIKVKILSSMQQRGFFLQQEHKYYGIQLYIVIEARIQDDDKMLEFLKELDINWELIFFRRKLAVGDWTQTECELNSENLKSYIRAKYETLNYFDINNITRLAIKNQLHFNVVDKMAALLYQMKAERSSQSEEDGYSITLKKAEIVAAAKLSCAYLGVKVEIEFDQDVSQEDILKFQDELTHI